MRHKTGVAIRISNLDLIAARFAVFGDFDETVKSTVTVGCYSQSFDFIVVWIFHCDIELLAGTRVGHAVF